MPYDATAAPPPTPDATPKPVAHWLHTVGLFVLLAASTVFTRHRSAASSAMDAPRIPRYLMSIGLEWLLLALVFAGIQRKREFLLTAFRNRARTLAVSVGIGCMVYCMGFVAIGLVSALLYFTPLAHQRNDAVILAMAPHTPLEFLVWFGVSFSAGLCEEVIFRGYLLQQLTAWMRSPIAAIVLGALLFGSVHLYEGLGAVLPLAALALVFGLVVRHFKGDLRAVVVAHTLQDVLVAFLLLLRTVAQHNQVRH